MSLFFSSVKGAQEWKSRGKRERKKGRKNQGVASVLHVKEGRKEGKKRQEHTNTRKENTTTKGKKRK